MHYKKGADNCNFEIMEQNPADTMFHLESCNMHFVIFYFAEKNILENLNLCKYVAHNKFYREFLFEYRDRLQKLYFIK